MFKRSAVFAGAAVVAFIVSGCASQPEVVEPQARYDTVIELRNAYVKAGGSCKQYDEHNRVTNAAQSADCNESTVLSIYLSEAKRDETIDTLKDVAVTEISLLVGENWIINTKDPEAYVEALGGTVVRTS